MTNFNFDNGVLEKKKNKQQRRVCCLISFCVPIGFWFDRSHTAGLCLKTSDTARISSWSNL